MNCPVCFSPDRAPAAEHNGLALYACDACRSVYMDPMPAPETLHALYDDPYAGATTGYYAKAEKKLRRARKRARMLDRYVETKDAFLEIGASGGFMTEAMRERGYRCTGVEPDAPGVAYAKEHYPESSFINGFFQDVESQLGQFDAIYCSEVIEHVPAPEPFVAAIGRHLKRGGVVNITTPDVTHWNKPADIKQWNEFNPPSHCLYYSPQGLSTILGRHGMTVFRHRFNWKAGLQVYARKTA